ncbi:MAG: TIGR02646 family protein [Oleispira sp.]|nr:TIGR02646 family protein [Oleispira sp.]MBL4881369.1 TIGR02646 family protein [Oleispira sp.]
MKKLIRNTLGPDFLSNCSHELHDWRRLRSRNRKKSLWLHLKLMQNGFCCYCESVAVQGNGHVEHFFYKGKKNGVAPYKDKTFEWSNLFGCCGTPGHSHCGHFKDKEGREGPGDYNPYDLIKPDEDDPSEYFHFIRSGHIRVNSDLSIDDERRAKETIRVLNLGVGSLNSAREVQIGIVKREVEALLDLTENLSDIKNELARIKSETKNSVFQTAVISALDL